MMDFYQISHPETVQIHIVLIMNNLTIIFFVFKLNKKKINIGLIFGFITAFITVA